MPGVGHATASRVLDGVARYQDLGQALRAFDPPAPTTDNWPAFVKLVEHLRSKQSNWPAELEQVRLWYGPHLERLHSDAHVRGADLIQLGQIAAERPWTIMSIGLRDWANGF